MSDIFISYSRKDIAYARLLHKALKQNDLETWVDWQDIPPSTEWLKEVFTAIEEANTFIFIISASSVISDICQKEIDHARQNNKRIIPIVIDDVEPAKVHPALSTINWIFSRTKDELQPSIEKLIEAIQTDYGWVKAHTRLQIRALEWEQADKDKSFLLQGTDLAQAENWLVESVDKEQEPTMQQTRYIQASRQGALRRQRCLFTTLKPDGMLLITVLSALRHIRLFQPEDVANGIFDSDTLTETNTMESGEGDQHVEVSVREHGFVVPELRLMLEVIGFEVIHIGGGTAGNWGIRPVELEEYELLAIVKKSS